MNSSQFKTFK